MLKFSSAMTVSARFLILLAVIHCAPASAQMTLNTTGPVYSNPGGFTGSNGGNGNSADCNKAWYGEGQPNDGGAGGAGGSYPSSNPPAVYDNSVSSTGSGIIVTSLGGNGG